MSESAGLTEKQEAFCQEYLLDLNATQAAIRAGYSEKTAGSIANQLRKEDAIQARLTELMEARSKRTEVTQDRVLMELARLAFSNMRDFVTWGPDGVSLKPSAELEDDDARCVAEVYQSVTQHGGSLRFKLHDKLGALRDIAKHLGMFNDDGDPVDEREVARKIIQAVREADERTGLDDAA